MKPSSPRDKHAPDTSKKKERPPSAAANTSKRPPSVGTILHMLTQTLLGIAVLPLRHLSDKH